MSNPIERPKSVTNFALNLVGPLAALVAMYVLRAMHRSGSDMVFLVCVVGVVPVVLLDVLVLRVHRRETTGLDWDRKNATSDVARVATKLLGLAATVGPIALAYFVFPEYGDWYTPFYALMRRFGVGLVACAVAYVWIVDGMMRDPYDAYWQIGRALLGHHEDARGADIANHARGWLIKAFYLPIFVVYTLGQIDGILKFDLAHVHGADMRLFHFSSDLIYALDVLYATVGYVLSFRIIDTHLRSAEPTLLGWAVALECYTPFWGGLFSRLYLHYEGIGFESWLSGHPTMQWAWAGAILALEGIYLLATFAFGVRFSNLTHRGILTGGPYRFTKHPAYVAKNLSWWLVTVPFIPSHGWVDALKSVLGLAGVNFIYYMRARTEERHLSRDPTYVQYALWMNEHGVLRWFGRISIFGVRPFRYAAPEKQT
jgi:protein-S-isoprenylcysteine O-methyltransferase Ste14